ncbi:MAG TPA: LLM class flavin-dependent oxidoreductase, partial [Chloroflexota bacterium]
MWREADSIPAFRGGWAFDHLYPWRADSRGACFEGWTLLSALAVETHRLRLGLLVTSNAYRHPAVLAKMVATVDIISAGRLELGMGAGGDVAEAEAFGMPLSPMARRIEHLDEACQVLQLLFTNDEANFAGHHYRLHRAHCEPKPVQRPAPPLVIGGVGDRLLAVAARWADGWNFPGGSLEAFKHALERLWAHCELIGRDPRKISVSAQLPATGPPDAIAEAGAALAVAGAG